MLRELAITLPGRTGDGNRPEKVEVRLLERAGEIQVAVRTRDAQLAHTLREGLGDLATRLEQSGYRTETWRPAEVSTGGSTRSGDSRHDSPDQDASSGFDRGGSGAGGGDGRQSRRDQESPEWVQALAGARLASGEQEQKTWPQA